MASVVAEVAGFSWLPVNGAAVFLLDGVVIPFSSASQVLADQPGPFRAIQVACRFTSHERELAEWLPLLANKGIQDLVLVNDVDFDFDEPSAANFVPLPTDILFCAELRRLFLGFHTFPGTTGLSTGAHILPHLQELSLFSTSINGRDLYHLLDCCPVLKKLIFVLSSTPNQINLGSKSLMVVLLWIFTAEELVVMDAPLLERLFLLEGPRKVGDGSSMMIKIHRVPNLQAVGFLDPGYHMLQIDNIIIKYSTVPSPSTIVPSVKILAFKVNFGVLKDVKMMLAYLRCFPNIETLHIEPLAEPNGSANTHFWRGVSTIECLKLHIKHVFVHNYRGTSSELGFLKFISWKAQQLQNLRVLLNTKSLSENKKKVASDVLALEQEMWSHECDIQVLEDVRGLQNDWSIEEASALSVNDPFRWRE